MIISINGLSGHVQICLNPETGETISSNCGDSLKFINDDHKYMHEVLLSKGFIFGCNTPVAKRNTWDFVYIRPYENLTIYFDKTFDYIVACNSADGAHRRKLCGLSFKEVTKYFMQEDAHLEF